MTKAKAPHRRSLKTLGCSAGDDNRAKWRVKTIRGPLLGRRSRKEKKTRKKVKDRKIARKGKKPKAENKKRERDSFIDEQQQQQLYKLFFFLFIEVVVWLVFFTS
jgi:hypothetical protein